MSSCLTGGSRGAYRLEALDINEFIKSPSTSWASTSSSPSSTLSESSLSPLAISTRKPRTPRKRPNQTYNEAAAILSTAHPKIFPAKNLSKFPKPHDDNKIPFFEPPDLLMIDTSGFLLHPPLLERPHFSKGFFEKACLSPGEISSKENSTGIFAEKFEEDFDAESILDEEIGQGIDSIMGNSCNDREIHDELNVSSGMVMDTTCYGYPVGLGFEYGFGVRNEMRAMRNNGDEGDWWRFPSVNVVDINPRIAKIDKVLGENLENLVSNLDENSEEIVAQAANGGVMLKLNYDAVLEEWSDKASPFSGDAPGNESAGKDVQARLAQIDLFSENGGMREASVLRYKEKRRTRLFSKKIRYQVRKVNADRRPRMKGRFVRTPNSPED